MSCFPIGNLNRRNNLGKAFEQNNLRSKNSNSPIIKKGNIAKKEVVIKTLILGKRKPVFLCVSCIGQMDDLTCENQLCGAEIQSVF